MSSGSVIQKARAQLDTGATISLITKRLASTLRAKKIPNSSTVLTGIGGSLTTLHQVELTLFGNPEMKCQDEEVTLRAHVIDHIPSSASQANVQRILQMPFLDGLCLADPHYTSAATIDILLDIGSFIACCQEGTRLSTTSSLKTERTIFGWTVGGTDTKEHQRSEPTSTCLRVSKSMEDPEQLLCRFWEVEQLPDDGPPRSDEEQQAVVHFQDTFRRLDDGRYQVSLPWKLAAPELGASREVALRRYCQNERSRKRQGTWDMYCDEVNNYSQLGHAELVPPKDLGKPDSMIYYLPMHGVEKSCSTTTKLRVVCDASAKTSSGVSLNDTLLVGPSLYPRLTSVVNRFRVPRIGMTADVSKMYRQIALHPDKTDYHRFLQRDEAGVMRDWRMTHLTFGVTTSPFLATQVL